MKESSLHEFNLKPDDMRRSFVIVEEFTRMCEKMSKLGPAVTIFGSARPNLSKKYYRDAEKIAALLAQNNVAVITGGAGGIMEAANKGAREAGGVSVGLPIRLPREEEPNQYLSLCMNHEYFFIRKVGLARYSMAYVVMPGGAGTQDEFWEVFTLMQTGRSSKLPIILYDRKFYQPIIDPMIDRFIEAGTASSEDKNLITYASTPEQVISIIKNWSFKNLHKLYKYRP